MKQDFVKEILVRADLNHTRSGVLNPNFQIRNPKEVRSSNFENGPLALDSVFGLRTWPMAATVEGVFFDSRQP
jgi:hypothetical protein